jgi:very-short-patch-repair endonuclease
MRTKPPSGWDTTTGRVRGTTREIESAARDLRQRMTPAERMLWNALRADRLTGLPFRRQHPLGHFVVDFACPTRKLAVEVDGDVHLERVEEDAARTELLASYGWEIIRFRNDTVLTDLPSVLRQIRAAAEARPIAPGRQVPRQPFPSFSTPSPTTLPSPKRGGGVGGEGRQS